MTFALLDTAALACMALEAVHFCVSCFARQPKALEAVYRRVDRLLGYRLQQLAWLSFDYLAIRLVVFVWQSESFDPWQASAVSAVLLLLSCALFYPLSFAWSALITPWCERRPIGHSLERCLPADIDLRLHWQALRNEYLAAAKRFGKLPAINDVFKDIALVEEATPPRARWTTVFLRVGARDFPVTMRHFPLLATLIDSPLIVGALFSCLEPGVQLKPHRGYFKGVLRYHLCLEVQDRERVWLDVDGQQYHWRAGEAIIFDDAYLHTAHNLSSHERVVLFLDVLRPLPPVLARINRALYAYAGVHPFCAVVEQYVNQWVAAAGPESSTH